MRFEEQIKANETFKALFATFTEDSSTFDITSREQCTGALSKFATLKVQSERIVKFNKYSDIFGQLKKLHAAYEASIAEFKQKHQIMLQGHVDSNLTEKAQKSQRKQHARYQKDYADLAADLKKLDQGELSVLVDFSPLSFIDSPDTILAVLDYIAPVTHSLHKFPSHQRFWSQCLTILILTVTRRITVLLITGTTYTPFP